MSLQAAGDEHVASGSRRHILGSYKDYRVIEGLSYGLISMIWSHSSRKNQMKRKWKNWSPRSL